MILLETTRDAVRATYLQSALSAEGIAVDVEERSTVLSGGPTWRIFVDDADAEQAQTFLRSLEP